MNTTKNFEIPSFSFSLSPVKKPFSFGQAPSLEDTIGAEITRHAAPSFDISNIVSSPMDEEESNGHEEYCDCDDCQAFRNSNDEEQVQKTQPYMLSNSQEVEVEVEGGEEDDGSVDLFPELDSSERKRKIEYLNNPHPTSPRIFSEEPSASSFSPIPPFRFPSTPYPGCINGREKTEPPQFPPGEVKSYAPIPVRPSKIPPGDDNKAKSSRAFASPYFEQTKRRLFSVNTTTTSSASSSSSSKMTTTSVDFSQQRPFFNYASSKNNKRDGKSSSSSSSRPSIIETLPFLPPSPSTKTRNEKAKRLDKLFNVTSDFIGKITKPSTLNSLNSINSIILLTAKLEHLRSQIEKEMEVDTTTTFGPTSSFSTSYSSSSSKSSNVPQPPPRNIWTAYPSTGGLKFHYHSYPPFTNPRKPTTTTTSVTKQNPTGKHFDDIVDD